MMQKNPAVKQVTQICCSPNAYKQLHLHYTIVYKVYNSIMSKKAMYTV